MAGKIFLNRKKNAKRKKNELNFLFKEFFAIRINQESGGHQRGDDYFYFYEVLGEGVHKIIIVTCAAKVFFFHST